MTGVDAGWYLRRLRRMSPQEVGHRVQDEVRRRTWARRQVRPGEVARLPEGLVAGRAFAAVLPSGLAGRVPSDVAAGVIAAADAVLAGEWTVLGAARTDSAHPDWFRDPLSGIRAPQAELAFRVRHRDESVTGNVKQVWEMSRHHHLTVLAAAYWLTGEDRYAENAAAQLTSWWRANPFLSGVHWTSGIEAGIRLISWVWTRRLLADWPKVGDLFEDNDDAIRQIGWHQEFLAGFVSRGSSSNNHVIAEAAGSLAAACAFPWYARTPQWRARSARLLERSVAANTLASGLNAELATDYHKFVLELVLLAALEADVAGEPLSDGSWHRAAKMLDAGAAILDPTGRPPRQGDGDEGRGLVVDPPSVDPWAVALGGAAAVLGKPGWAGDFTVSLQAVLFGGLAGGRRIRQRPPEQRPAQFADAGLVLLRSAPADGPEIWVRVDAGPHGFLSIAAHAHADALSLEMRHDGTEILADNGTYCYHGEPRWRQWFRSTAGHNTVQLADVDQSESGGPFLWTRHARTTTFELELGGPVRRWSGAHDGYTRLETPAVHHRSVELDSAGRTLTVTDRVDTAVPQRVRISWHLGPNVAAELTGAVADLSWPARDGTRHARVSLPGCLSWSAHRGETDPVEGWYSPAFGIKVPAVSLIGRGSAAMSDVLVTRICFDG